MKLKPRFPIALDYKFVTGIGRKTLRFCLKISNAVFSHFALFWFEIVSVKPFCTRASQVNIHGFRVMRQWLSEDAGNVRLFDVRGTVHR